MQIIKPLPNPFLMADGSHVTTEDDWQRRRMEIKDILLRIQYGTAPPAPDLVSSESLSQQTGESGETRQEVRLTFTPDRSRLDITFGMDVTVWHPSPESIARRKLAVQGFGASGIPALVYVGNSVFKSVLDSGIAMLCCAVRTISSSRWKWAIQSSVQRASPMQHSLQIPTPGDPSPYGRGALEGSWTTPSPSPM